jgi:hypothetical protein
LEFHFIIEKDFLATAVTVIAGFFISANAGTTRHKMDKESRKQIRKEKREERRELWLHSVNVTTETQFYNDFPNTKDVSWTEGAFAEATFYEGDILKTAYYDTDNALVGTTTDVDYSVLPDKAKQYINKKYPGYTVKKVVLFDDNEANDTNMFLFSNSFKDEDTYFPVIAKGSKEIILKVSMSGETSFFQNYK